MPMILTLSLTSLREKARAQHPSYRGTAASSWDYDPGNLVEAAGLKGRGTCSGTTPGAEPLS